MGRCNVGTTWRRPREFAGLADFWDRQHLSPIDSQGFGMCRAGRSVANVLTTSAKLAIGTRPMIQGRDQKSCADDTGEHEKVEDNCVGGKHLPEREGRRVQVDD